MRPSALGAFAMAFSLTLTIGCTPARSAAAPTSPQAGVPGHSSSTLRVGDKIPAFRAVDQFGKQRDFYNLQGPNGLVVLFFRSADWCPFCKGQLVELQKAQQRFKEKGIGLVGISYDSQAILKYFSARYGITFPLLADPHSEIIRRFGVLNPRGAGFSKGMAIPGFFYVKPDSRIQDAFFGVSDAERFTANNVIAKLFPELISGDERTIPALHLNLELSQSDTNVVHGNSVTLIAVVSLPPDVHVYAPGVQGGYKPIALELDPTPDAVLHRVHNPRPKIMFLPVIHDKVPVFEGTFRITEDATIAYDKGFIGRVMKGPASGTPVTLKGTLFYQACDSKICYLPTSVPVSWKLMVKHLNRSRAPLAIQHK